uniref:VIgL family C1q-related protein 7 n=1 Tax=Littorina littorea TaxID=31216 RepID=A0A411DEN5_LITLI|nr:VIgL family C1q-related protein 7 [Littorina littorea]
MLKSPLVTVLFVEAVLLGVVSCFEWTFQPDTMVYSCTGKQVTLPWEFKTDDEESVLQISWIFGDVFDSVLVATVSFDTFVPTEAYLQRVHHVTNGGLYLRDVTMKDSGNYTVEVNTEKHGTLSTSRHSVFLQVGDGLMTQGNELKVKQDPRALWDDSTAQWVIRLICGTFTFMGQPNIHVIWTTPEGETRSSTYYEDNNFYLTLLSPVEGGNYTCLIPIHLLPDICANTSSHGNETVSATVGVDDLRVRLSLIEAEQKTLGDRLRESEETCASETIRLKEANTDLLKLLNETRIMHDQEQETVYAEIQTLRNVTQNQQVLLDNQKKQVAFTVRFDSVNGATMNVGRSGTIMFDFEVTNRGNYFNMSTGIFTAPVAGTYFFVLGAMIPKGQPYAEMGIHVSGKGVLALTHGGQNYIRDQTHAALHLNEGDQVKAKHCWGGTVIEKYFWTTFSGVLLQPD